MSIFRTLVWLLRLKPNGSMTEKFNWALLLDNVLSHSKNMVPYYRAHAGGAQRLILTNKIAFIFSKQLHYH